MRARSCWPMGNRCSLSPPGPLHGGALERGAVLLLGSRARGGFQRRRQVPGLGVGLCIFPALAISMTCPQALEVGGSAVLRTRPLWRGVVSGIVWERVCGQARGLVGRLRGPAWGLGRPHPLFWSFWSACFSDGGGELIQPHGCMLGTVGDQRDRGVCDHR